MRAYRLELVLGAILAFGCTLVWLWQSPSTVLSDREIDRYLAQADANLAMPPAEKAAFLQRVRIFAAADDGGPVYMVNLMRFYDRIQPGAGVPATFKGTPREANEIYDSKVIPIVLRLGAIPVFTGKVDEPNLVADNPSEDHWSRFAVVRWPERRGFLKMLADPEYGKYVPYKEGSLEVGLVPTKPEIPLPDLRLVVIVLSTIIFLAFGWLRERRRNAGAGSAPGVDRS